MKRHSDNLDLEKELNKLERQISNLERTYSNGDNKSSNRSISSKSPNRSISSKSSSKSLNKLTANKSRVLSDKTEYVIPYSDNILESEENKKIDNFTNKKTDYEVLLSHINDTMLNGRKEDNDNFMYFFAKSTLQMLKEKH